MSVLPSSPTIAERISWRLSVPFPVVCVAISAILTLPIVPYLFPGSESSLMTTALNRGMGVIHEPEDAVLLGLVWVFFAYLLWATRFMRLRVARTLEEAHDLFDFPGATFVRAFEPVGWRWPAAAMAVILTALAAGTFVSEGDVIGPGYLPAFILDLLIGAGRLLVLTVYVWAYFASVRGLGVICRERLRLVPYYRDPLLGTRPLGTLSLALASAFAFGYALGLAWSLHDPLRSGFFFAALAIIGLAAIFFFLPLLSVHAQMVDEKERELAFVRDRYAELFEISRHQPGAGTREVTLADVTSALALEASERRITRVHTWPFDTDILARLATSFAIPVIITVVGREAVLLVLGL
jgi:hypothetical protein